MPTTQLLPVRTADGRLCYASYKDQAEKAQILAWVEANNARVETTIKAPASASDRLL